MNYRRFKSLSLLTAVLLSAMVLIGWSQTWFIFEVSFADGQSQPLDISGQQVAGALSALGLTGFALTAALALAGILLRRILGVLLFLLGMGIFWATISPWADPISAAAPALTTLSAISDVETLRTFVVSTSMTAWPGVTAVIGLLFLPLGILIFFTAGKWGTASRKFERTSKNSTTPTLQKLDASSPGLMEDISAQNIDAWDSLSHGDDPTIK
ncbi:putative membrane protein (TIGR02234 family) [Aurantimicrobium minutum]|uniref:Trp biosynthesis-associated membrane protein n=1 Tax=Aurantimicrobium minutum TaxID=708131 RepID=UPI00247328CE|nr:Trp biosynthesis-associated membrane protein [Aurantimicrobium minutum]MDH6532972.1 putative membrane protein (TIGR02234 family) [Aurantimicrobium minutum]